MKKILSNFVGVYDAPPNGVRSSKIPDAPLLGNGDIAVAVDGTYTSQTFHLSKSDLSQKVRRVGRVKVDFQAPRSAPERYRQEQDLLRAEVRSQLAIEGGGVQMRSWTADGVNLLVTDLRATGGRSVDVTIEVQAPSGAGAEDDLIWAMREHDGGKAAFATRVLGAVAQSRSDKPDSAILSFTLPADTTVQMVTFVAGGHGATRPAESAQTEAKELTPERLAKLHESHLAWWENYWRRSYIEINDELLEKFYYGALYVLGCSTRAGSVAPGLAGAWHTSDSPIWSNSYTMNYNFVSPYWGVYSANRPELAMPLYDAVLNLIPEARKMAAQHGTKGIWFPVNVNAWGHFTDRRTLGQKSNASLAAMNFIMHYGYTRDDQFLIDKAWPLLRELAIFWEDNLEWDENRSRWVVSNSGAREGGKDTNPINDLAYIRRIFSFLLSVSDTLDGTQSTSSRQDTADTSTRYLDKDGRIKISEATRRQWRGYVEHLSDFPTTKFDGTTVFKEAEKGPSYQDGKFNYRGPGDNADVLMHVFPGEALSLGSRPELLRIAQNTVSALNANEEKLSWFQCNNFPKIFTQAVRTGYSGAEVAGRLKQMLAGNQSWIDRGDHVRLMNNFAINAPYHGWESVGAIEAINSMLLQSHDGVIRVFPAWIDGKDASFTRLRAYGAFLVSSEYRDKQVRYVRVKSEAGRRCSIENPWPGRTPEVYAIQQEQKVKIDCRIEGTIITFSTEEGEEYQVLPGDELLAVYPEHLQHPDRRHPD